MGTRKGTSLVDRAAGGGWQPTLAGHAGVGANFVARDPHTGTLWSALGHGTGIGPLSGGRGVRWAPPNGGIGSPGGH